MIETSLPPEATAELFQKLRDANLTFNLHYPGESTSRQPVHTVYGGAHLFKADSCQKLAVIARATFNQYAPDSGSLASILQFSSESSNFSMPSFAQKVYDRVLQKLDNEAVEDFRIDFEDGYGHRSDAEEDGHAQAAAGELARALEAKTLPPFIGIRIKAMTEEVKRRSARTLDIFLTTFLALSKGRLPDNFVVTLPKVTVSEQVTCLVGLLQMLENKHGLKQGEIKIELMIEQTQSLINEHGHCPLPALVEASRGRCRGVHFGTYDYTASCDIISSYQSMLHPACDFARNMMKVSLAGTGIWLSDGATNILPVTPHRPAGVNSLSDEQKRENERVVHRAWKLAYDHNRHSLQNGYYQGWDLHPAQIPIRYAACYAFFLEGLDSASARLKSFIEKAAQATLLCDVFDDAASGQGLLNYFLRAINCGAISEEDVRATGLTLESIQSRSFLKILESRRKLIVSDPHRKRDAK